MNNIGAPNVLDRWKNVGELLQDPEHQEVVRKLEEELKEGKSSLGIFRAIGKREKKKHGEMKGSRMVAYLHIPMRYIESKYLSCLTGLTKPDILPMGVGGLGLHDLGMRLNEIWKSV
uniref:Genome polyprotein n=1 Tax=Cacopsylla melanoneura TaxID=428564 RepID=A0A8D8ZJN9_9HEMI